MPSKIPARPLRLPPDLEKAAESHQKAQGGSLHAALLDMVRRSALDLGYLKGDTPTPPKGKRAKVEPKLASRKNAVVEELVNSHPKIERGASLQEALDRINKVYAKPKKRRWG